MTEGLLAILRKCTGLNRLEVHGWFMQNINDRCVLLCATLFHCYSKWCSATLLYCRLAGMCSHYTVHTVWDTSLLR
jgi:hypothetical protein